MKAIRTVLLWLLALVLLAVVSWGVALFLDWPLWSAAALFFGVLGLYFLLKFVRRLIIAWRSRSIVARQDRASRRAASEASATTKLRRKFRGAIELLRGSSLRRLGNPLYALPWYMVIGRSGAGKTTALTRARLASSMQGPGGRQNAVVQKTENCDWWYFDKSVVIDSAGRYVDPDNLDADRREWEVALDLLSRYRSREGLNGLVLAISADRLITIDPDALDEEARVIRSRIEQLIRLFGKRFPVYVLVTKCDQLYGFEQWSRLLPEAALNQAMGYLAEEDKGGASDTTFLTAAFDSVVSRLQVLRLGLVAQHPKTAVELLLFPNELESLRSGLGAFVHACLGNNPYLESPFLRGLFFSSGLQEGGARSNVFGDTVAPAPVHEPSTTGVFLHDLFDQILPRDRNIAKPAALVNRWFAATQHLGMLAWIMLALAIGILMTMSFIRKVNTLNLIRDSYPFSEVFTGRLIEDAATLTKSNTALRLIDRRNRDWRSRWMTSSNIDDLEAKLHARYVDQYRQYIRPATQIDFDNDLQHLLVSDPDGQLPGYILNEVRTINLLKRKIAGADRPQLAAMPRPIYDDTAHYSPELFDQINELRISYAAWSPSNAQALADRVASSQATLAKVIYRDPLRWVTMLAPIDARVKPVTLASFWLDPSAQPAQDIDPPDAASEAAAASAGASASAAVERKAVSGHIRRASAVQAPATQTQAAQTTLQNSSAVATKAAEAAAAEQARLAAITVPGAYTQAGRADIDGYLNETQQAVDDVARFTRQRALFEQDYLTRRLQVWQTFITNVPEGERLLSGKTDWNSKLATLTHADSPYLRALDSLNDEFSDLPDAQLPDWLQLARRLGKLRDEATGAQLAGSAGSIVRTINSFGGQAIQQTIASNPTAGAQTLRANSKAATALRDYFTGVDQIASTVTDGPAKAYEISAAFHDYGIDPAVKTSPVHDTARALSRFRTAFPQPGAADQAVWHLIDGPLHFALAYTEEETSCALQADWESKVYWPLQSATSMSQVVDQLYGPQGTVWSFVDGSAKPFVRRTASEITIAETSGYSVPFTDAFLPTLNSAVGKRVAQLMDMQRDKARTEQQQAQAQAAQDQAKLQQTNAETALADIKQKTAAAHAQAYPLTITAQPTDVNAGARARPFATVLTVQCASGARTLTNFNFPVSDSFTWALGQCGEVSLLIRINGVTLTKRYRGDAGVVNFLQDFRDGHHLFSPDDFPAAREALAALQIQQITVRYDFQGQAAIIAGAQQLAQLADDQQHQAQLRQQAIDEQANQTQQLLLIKTASASGVPEQPLQVSLPQRVGVCWNADAKPPTAQTLKQMFDGLTDKQGALLTAAAPISQGALSSFAPSTVPDVPPLPTVPNTPSPAAPPAPAK